jgi:trehalose 6-phosphate phosphatase
MAQSLFQLDFRQSDWQPEDELTSPAAAADAFAREVGARLPSALIALDFDGTLSDIVEDPSAARPVPGANHVLRRLERLGAQIGIVSGRQATTVLSLSGLADLPGLTVAGLYGGQWWRDGTLQSIDPPPGIDQLRRSLPELIADVPGAWIEDKELSLVIHARSAGAGALDGVEARVRELASLLGFEVHPGRAVLEMRPPGLDKGSALRRLVERAGRDAVVYCGDDVGDIPAFEYVTSLRAGGASAWSVAVRSAEAPGVAEHATVSVSAPDALVGLLQKIADQASGAQGSSSASS